MEFLVEISLEGTDALSPDELQRLRAAETLRAQELADEGVLVRLWRPSAPGWRNVGLWQAASEVDLREAIASLPFAPYMTVVCRPLGAHPSDPQAMGTRVL